MLDRFRFRVRRVIREMLSGPTCLACGHSMQNHQWVAYSFLCFEDGPCRSAGPCAFREEIR